MNLYKYICGGVLRLKAYIVPSARECEQVEDRQSITDTLRH